MQRFAVLDSFSPIPNFQLPRPGALLTNAAVGLVCLPMAYLLSFLNLHWEGQPIYSWLIWLLALALALYGLAEVWDSWRLWPAARALKNTGYKERLAPRDLTVKTLTRFVLPLLSLAWAAVLVRHGLALKGKVQLVVLALALLVIGLALPRLALIWRRWHYWQRVKHSAAIPPRQPPRRSVALGVDQVANGLGVLGLLAIGLLVPQWYAVILIIALRAGWWLWQAPAAQHWGYDRPGDYFYYYSGWRRQRQQRFGAAVFVGIYCENLQIWLVGPRREGGDKLLVRLERPSRLPRDDYDWGSWLLATAERLSDASGLPLLYRWPVKPAVSLGKNSN